MQYSLLKSKLFIAAGFISIGVGIIGVWTPFLPTTEFLLFAAFCFARGSERWHNWLMTHPRLSPYIKAFSEKRGLTRRQKLRMSGLMTFTLLLTAFAIPSIIGKIAAALIWSGLMAYLALRRSAAEIDIPWEPRRSQLKPGVVIVSLSEIPESVRHHDGSSPTHHHSPR